MTTYEKQAKEYFDEAERLRGMAERFRARNVRVGRIPAILAEADRLEAIAKKTAASGRWAKEIWG